MKGKKNEEDNKKDTSGESEIRHGLVTSIILGTIAVAGVLGLALMAPGAFQIVKFFQQYNRMRARRYEAPSYIRRTLKSLERRGMIRIIGRDGEARAFLTEKGEQELLRYKLREKRLKYGRWDKKWRIIIFDIEEKRRSIRDRVRESMQSFGFEKLQDSVWVYPYECEEVVTLLKTQYKVGKQVVYIVASDIENDMWLRKKFSLQTPE